MGRHLARLGEGPARVTLPIRPFRAGDLDALHAVCLRTAHHGGDATPLHADGRLPGDVYAAPYAVLEPHLAFVAEDAEGVCGYVVGTADTVAFADRCEAAWWPALRRRGPPAQHGDTPDAALWRHIHAPGVPAHAFLATHPAHLHLNVLPRGQGTGTGAALIRTFLEALARRGTAGVHLGVSARNRRAIAFYHRSGFSLLVAEPWGDWMGLSLA